MWPGNALPQHGDTNWKVFYASGTDWQTYMKPPGASMIYILMIAAGAGGSRVANGNVTTAGGGGGSGGTSRILLPAGLLPDILYVRPGKGGLGATTENTVGGAGATSYVGVSATVLQTSNILQQGGAPAPTNTQVQGAAGTVANVVNSSYSSLGLYYSNAGQSGTAGSATANANASSLTVGVSSSITSGGGGGANGTGTAGNILAAGFFPALTTIFDGCEGFRKGAIIGPGLKSFPMIFTGGTGGIGVTTAVTAGNGGNASYGGGGGGGGSGTNAGSISGNGGNGGDGLIIIGSF